jgi:hypothetical protein
MTKELADAPPTIIFTHPLPIQTVLMFLHLATMTRMSAREDRRRMATHQPGSEMHGWWDRQARAAEGRAEAYRKAAEPALAKLWERPLVVCDYQPVLETGRRMDVDHLAALGAEMARVGREKGILIGS